MYKSMGHFEILHPWKTKHPGLWAHIIFFHDKCHVVIGYHEKQWKKFIDFYVELRFGLILNSTSQGLSSSKACLEGSTRLHNLFNYTLYDLFNVISILGINKNHIQFFSPKWFSLNNAYFMVYPKVNFIIKLSFKIMKWIFQKIWNHVVLN